MEPLKVKAEDFRLLCKFTCYTREIFDDDINDVISTTYGIKTAPDLQTKKISFDVNVPDGATIKSAHVYATLSPTTYGAQTCTINGVGVNTGGTACVEVDIADGETTVDVTFRFLTMTPSHTHEFSDRSYTVIWVDGARECGESYVSHEAFLDYTDVYLLIEYADSYTPPELLPYTDPNPIVGETYVKAVHMTELHENVNRLRIAKGLAAYAFASITAMQTSLAGWNAHVLEIRVALDEVSTEHDAWLVLDVNRPRLDVLMQLRSMVEVLAA